MSGGHSLRVGGRRRAPAMNRPPLKTAGLVTLAACAAVLTLIYLQFRGDLSPKATLTMVSDRAGLVMDAGSKVTYNGVVIGRVGTVSSTDRDGKSAARGDPRRRSPLPGGDPVQRARRHQGEHGVRQQVRGADDARAPDTGPHPTRPTSSRPPRSPPSSTRCSRPSPRSPRKWTRSRST